MLTLGEIQKAGAAVSIITLAPLDRTDLNSLIADALVCEKKIATPLTELVHQKTQGNPFFATQFLKYLHEEGLINFNCDRGYWQCDLSQIKLLAVSIDRQFAGMGEGEIAPNYRFLHDRIQQAACSLIEPEHREAAHLKIGRLLPENLSETEQKEKIFDIVNQLNIAVKLIEDVGDRLQLSSLNLGAGKKAKESTAYRPAISYLTAGQQLLPANSWKTDYELTFNLSQELAECEYLCGNFDAAENLFDEIISQVKTAE